MSLLFLWPSPCRSLTPQCGDEWPGTCLASIAKGANLEVLEGGACAVRLEIIEDNRLTAHGECQNSEAENENNFFHGFYLFIVFSKICRPKFGTIFPKGGKFRSSPAFDQNSKFLGLLSIGENS